MNAHNDHVKLKADLATIVANYPLSNDLSKADSNSSIYVSFQEWKNLLLLKSQLHLISFQN